MSRCFRLVAAIFLAIPLPAADQWVKLTTPNFELYTSAGEKKGREAILYFEQVRSFFQEASGSKRVPEFPVRIVAFRGEKQYQPYRMNEAAFAYYARGRSRDYIVMQDIAGDHYPAAIHEYTHLIVEHAGLNLPPWLNEGLAELYSTLKPMGKKAAVGDIIPGRAQALVTNKWIPLDILTFAGHDSPLYNERNRAGMFYAESWALTHMLAFSPDYRPNFTKFLVTIGSGKAMDEACQTALGKHLWDVEVSLRQYLQGQRFYRALFDIKLEKSAEDPDVAEVPEFESGLVLADLLALAHRTSEAKSAYEQLAKSNPGKPEVEEALGYLAWQSGDNDGARDHFGRALAAGTRNARMCFDYAMLSRSASDADKNALSALKRALELKPDYAEARFQLGLMLVNIRNYVEAITELRQIKKIDPEQAQWYFPALAFAYFQTGDLDKARENAEAAKKWAKTPQQTEQADSLLRSVDARKAPPTPPIQPVQAREAPPPIKRVQAREFSVVEERGPENPFVTKDDKMSRVEGIAQRLDCTGNTARLHVLVGKTPMIFEIPDPNRVLIKHSGELTRDFVCGPQTPYKVVVDYAMSADPKRSAAGIIRALEF